MSDPQRTETVEPTATSAVSADTTKTLRDEPRGRTGWARILLGRDAIMIYLLIATIIIAMISIPRFASPVTVGFLLLDVIPVLLIAMPMTLIIITGEIDLSVASHRGPHERAHGRALAGRVGHRRRARPRSGDRRRSPACSTASSSPSSDSRRSR